MVSTIYLANTIRYPGTMMVKLFYTSITCGTVFGANRSDYLKQKHLRAQDINVPRNYNNHMHHEFMINNPRILLSLLSS